MSEPAVAQEEPQALEESVSAERRAAQALAAVFKEMPGVVAALVGGNTVEEV